MINIIEKRDCCGCGACAQKCLKQCITLKQDNEGFLYPDVDTESCINCGLCEKVCPVLNPYKASNSIQTFAAINNDEKIRKESSSGGIFTLLAESVINQGGVVFGARYDEEWQVTLDYTDTIEGLSAFRGSKYVQARTGETYKQCEKFLKEGCKVLFSGTSCQIAGLKHFLSKEYVNLLTVDVVCHGTPSPKVWKLYLKEVVDNLSDIKNISMRDKSRGWKQFSFVMNYSKRDKMLTLSVPFSKNDYMQAFLKNMILRPSCYNCPAKEFKCGSDMTIADYWGIQNVAPEMNDDRGTGLVLINTEKGRECFEKLDLKKRETTFEEGYRCNPAIFKSARPWYSRDDFFSKLDDAESVIFLIQEELKPTPEMIRNEKIRAIKALPKRIVKKLIRLICVGGGNSLNINHINNGNIDIIQLNNILSGREIELSRCCFRDKTTSWSNYNVTFTFKIV